MKIARLALVIALIVPWRAFAQEEPNPDPAEIQRAGADEWFLQYIADALPGSHFDDSVERNPVLYDPKESAPLPGKPGWDRKVYTHRAHVGKVGAVLMAGDLPAARSDWNDVKDWNEPYRPEMFRFYFETVPPAKDTHDAE
jgi:hypothetical protein